MAIGSRKSNARRQLWLHAALLALSAVSLVPFYWMVSTSLKSDAQVLASPPVWIPSPAVFSNYTRALSYIPFLTYAKNTLIICVSTMVGAVLSCSLVAYSFAKLRWPGRDALFVIVLATMMLPGQVTMIPVFAVFRWLGWIGSYKPLIVPSFLGSAFFIFMLRQFFLTIPQELSDAARVDGAGEFAIYRVVILPLSKPALITVALFTFIGSWNDFLGPLVFIDSLTRYTLPVGIALFQTQYFSEYGLTLAACVICTLPVIILFLVFQRQIVRGITFTGLKE